MDKPKGTAVTRERRKFSERQTLLIWIVASLLGWALVVGLLLWIF